MVSENSKRAVLHRMVLDGKPCPYGVKARALLEREGYTVEEHLLTTRAAVDAFKESLGVSTTPQAFINGVRIGGYDDLRSHFGDSGAGVANTN